MKKLYRYAAYIQQQEEGRKGKEGFLIATPPPFASISGGRKKWLGSTAKLF